MRSYGGTGMNKIITYGGGVFKTDAELEYHDEYVKFSDDRRDVRIPTKNIARIVLGCKDE